MLQRITLHLARSPDFPEGSVDHGYEIVAPLDAGGHLDDEEWRSKRAQCRVRRFWPGEPDRYGLLVHRHGGADGATWMIDYNLDRTDDDESGYRLGTHTFRVGDYVSIRDADSDLHTFRIVDVQPLSPMEPAKS
jgi:hypothetical protein